VLVWTNVRAGSTAGMCSARAISRGNFLSGGLPHAIAISNDSTHLIPTPSIPHKMALVAYRNLLRSARIAFQGTYLPPRVKYGHLQSQATSVPSPAPVLQFVRTSSRTATYESGARNWRSHSYTQKRCRSSYGRMWYKDKHRTLRATTVRQMYLILWVSFG
jgi:hypothetical protein